jgi:hypothetical protein
MCPFLLKNYQPIPRKDSILGPIAPISSTQRYLYIVLYFTVVNSWSKLLLLGSSFINKFLCIIFSGQNLIRVVRLKLWRHDTKLFCPERKNVEKNDRKLKGRGFATQPRAILKSWIVPEWAVDTLFHFVGKLCRIQCRTRPNKLDSAIECIYKSEASFYAQQWTKKNVTWCEMDSSRENQYM